MSALDYSLLCEAYEALEAVQVHTGRTLTEILEEPETLGDLLHRIQTRLHDLKPEAAITMDRAVR